MRAEEIDLLIPLAGVKLPATVRLPDGLTAAVVFAHASGSDRYDLRDQYLADELAGAGIGTIRVDLLTPDERKAEAKTQHLRFDLDLLAERLDGVAQWLLEVKPGIELGYCTAGTGTAAALTACARHGRASAVVARAGRPDLAAPELKHVRAATLLLVGAFDPVGIEANRDAVGALGGPTRLEVVPNATHRFDEPGTLEHVAQLARAWFVHWLSAARETRDEVHMPW